MKDDPHTTYTIKARLVGTPQQYFTLRMFHRGVTEPQIHTSKLRSYILSKIPPGAVEIKDDK